VLGGGFLDGGAVTLEVPLLGEVKATSALAFDIGVFAVVVGMVGLTLESLSEGGTR
jgi:multicomponent Na+:H+ antiporter subunit A